MFSIQKSLVLQVPKKHSYASHPISQMHTAFEKRATVLVTCAVYLAVNGNLD